MLRGFAVLGRGAAQQRLAFTLSVLGSSLWALMTVGQAYVLGRITENTVLPAFREGRVLWGSLLGAALLIMGVAALKALGIAGRRIYAGRVQYELGATYRRKIAARYLALPLRWHQAHPTGRLLSLANSDVEQTWEPMAPFPMAVGVVVMLLVTLAFLVATDPVLALVGGVIFPLIAVLNVIYSRRLAPLMIRAQELRAEVSGLAHESFDGALTVKVLGRGEHETQRFAEQAGELRDALIRVGRLRGLFDPALEALPNLSVLAVLLVGGLRVSAGSLDPGGLVRVAYLFTLLAFPVRAIGWVLADLPRAVVGWERMHIVLNADDTMPAGQRRFDPADPTGEPAQLAATGIGFGYGAAVGDDRVLDDVTLDVPAGSTVAIVGPTGSGKSTLAHLSLRLLDPDEGVLTVDGHDLRELAAGQLAEAVALVPQGAFLFDDTVRGNVTLGADIEEPVLAEALEISQAAGFVADLPDGIDTVVGERGATLSGGQRQRIALARALARRPRLLVLDDATSSVDPRIERAILAGLRESPSTVVVIAYRQATIALADLVIYLEDGRVRGRGTHEQLMASVPGYREVLTAYGAAHESRPGAESAA
ncbi:MAG TPA: ABC transporter ATP-binding protein [Frankiaceae bacterium]|nr:ABC transporter ATP-binding protein [Frankiaceae bacterium]